MNKQQLANIAYTLYANIDRAEQFDMTRLFYHCDNKFLRQIIVELADAVRDAYERDSHRSETNRDVWLSPEELEQLLKISDNIKEIGTPITEKCEEEDRHVSDKVDCS